MDSRMQHALPIPNNIITNIQNCTRMFIIGREALHITLYFAVLQVIISGFLDITEGLRIENLWEMYPKSK